MSHEFPAAPVVGVGAVVVRDGKALIVKRAHDPRKGEWSLPGGRVELGESLEDATRREIKEETGLDIEVGPLVEVFDRVHPLDGRIRYHFVIVDYLCRPIGGTLACASDAEAAEWVSVERLDRFSLTQTALDVIAKALRCLGS